MRVLTVLLMGLPLVALANKPGTFSHSLSLDVQALQAVRSGRIGHPGPDLADRASVDRLHTTVRFAAPVTERDAARWQARGVELRRHNGELLQVGGVIGAWVPWDQLDALAVDPNVVRVELGRPMHQAPPLDVSGPEVQATVLHSLIGADGSPLTGAGVRVLDLDTGINITHPSFFRPDGGNFEWEDVDGDGVFSEGVDGVDYDGDGSVDADEVLWILDAETLDYSGAPMYGSDGYFEADVDWLFIDLDGDGSRGHGADAGFSDADPAFGEPLFIVEDVNEDATLGLDERVVLLGSSKLVATMDGSDGTTHSPGDLIDTEPDANGHGTNVSGIVMGENHQWRRFSGMAPEVDYLAGDIFSNTAHSEVIAWGDAEGADVQLHEVGAYSGQFMDGSSNREIALAASAASGVTHVCPAGNIGKNYKHGKVTVAADGEWHGAYYFTNPSYMETYGSGYFYITVISPDDLGGLSVAMKQNEGSSYIYPEYDNWSGDSDGEGNWFYSARSSSSNGTSMLYGYMLGWADSAYQTPSTGWWDLWFQNTGDADVELHIWLADDVTSWSGGVNFYNTPAGAGSANYIGDEFSTATVPSTTPECVTVAAYSTRADTYGQDFTGGSYDLAPSSGRGPRLDGVELVDVGAPGYYDVFTAESEDGGYAHGGFGPFGGTSAAGPHVAGAAALLMQATPDAHSEDVHAALRAGAASDGYTGSGLPDDEWGAGKLRVSDSLRIADQDGPQLTQLTAAHPLLPGLTQVVLAPSETLAGPPEILVDGESADPIAAEGDLWLVHMVEGGTLDWSAEDLSGNQTP